LNSLGIVGLTSFGGGGGGAPKIPPKKDSCCFALFMVEGFLNF